MTYSVLWKENAANACQTNVNISMDVSTTYLADSVKYRIVSQGGRFAEEIRESVLANCCWDVTISPQLNALFSNVLIMLSDCRMCV